MAHSATATLPPSPPPFSPEARQEAVCAVMVTHCTGEALLQTVPVLLQEAQRLIIVDNCSDEETLRLLNLLTQRHAGRIELLLRERNNLAAAQNDGIRRALEEGYGWVLLMDHDSVPAPGMVASMRKAWSTLPKREEIGILAPCLTDIHSGRQARYPQAAGKLRCKRIGFSNQPVLDGLMGVVASGSLIPAHILREVGMMDEALCIDYVDKDFCLRVVRSGYRIVAVRDAVLHHQLGHCRDHTLLGMHITTTNHSPQRCYYIYRNRLKSWGKHGAAMPAFVVYDFLAMSYDMIRLVCFEEQKMAKLRAMAQGFYDALRGISGSAEATRL